MMNFLSGGYALIAEMALRLTRYIISMRNGGPKN